MTEPALHIVDDDPDFRAGLAWLLSSRGHTSATWDSGPAFLQGIAKRTHATPPVWGIAVVLLDIRMEPLSGLATFEQLKAQACPWPVLFLTGHGDVSMAVSAVKNGAWDFLEKPFQNNDLIDRVEQALHAAQAAQQTQSEQDRLKQSFNSLSVREREVLHQLIQGHYNKNIAENLGITMRTVEFHRANIFEKMGVNSAVELAHQLGRLGLSP